MGMNDKPIIEVGCFRDSRFSLAQQLERFYKETVQFKSIVHNQTIQFSLLLHLFLLIHMPLPCPSELLSYTPLLGSSCNLLLAGPSRSSLLHFFFFLSFRHNSLQMMSRMPSGMKNAVPYIPNPHVFSPFFLTHK